MTYLSHWKRLLGPAGLALAAVLLMSGLARAQETVGTSGIAKPAALKAYGGREENEVIPLELEKAKFGDVGLPFDVAFKLEGPMPEKFGKGDRLDARWVEFNRVPDCESFFSQFMVTPERLPDLNLTDNIPVRRPRRPDRAIAQSGFKRARVFDAVTGRTVESSMVQLGAATTTTTTTTTTETKLKFLSDFPALKPNHYYCFQFISRRSLKGDELEKLQAKFAEVADSELRQEKYLTERPAPDGTTIPAFAPTRGEYDSLRRRLAALVEEQLTGPDQVVQAPRNSFFDVGADLDDITATYREEFSGILATTGGARLAQIRNIEGVVDSAARALADVGEKQYLDGDQTRSLAAILGDRTLEDGALKTLVDHLGDFGQLKRLSEGLPPDPPADPDAEPAADLRQVWKPGQIQERINRIETLSRSLLGLIGLARSAGAPEAELQLVEGPSDIGMTAEPDALDNLFDEPSAQPAAPPAQPATAQAAPAATLGALVSRAINQLAGAKIGLTELKKILEDRSTAIEAWVEQVLVEEQKNLVVGANTIAKYDTRAVWYMSADLGAGLSPDTEDLFTYIGWNIYLRPVNKKSHLSWAGRPFGLGQEFMRRFSFTLGVVREDIKADDARFKGVIGGKAGVLGAGFRINDSLRLSVGGLVFETVNPDPLIGTTTLNWSPYVALSFDWNATATIAGLFARGGQ